MFNNEFSKWTLTIFNEDLNVEWALSVIKSKRKIVLTGALVTFLNDAYFDYVTGKSWNFDDNVRVVCDLMIFSCILFIYVINRDVLEEDQK